jgi:hypothetical protein
MSLHPLETETAASAIIGKKCRITHHLVYIGYAHTPIWFMDKNEALGTSVLPVQHRQRQWELLSRAALKELALLR